MGRIVLPLITNPTNEKAEEQKLLAEATKRPQVLEPG